MNENDVTVATHLKDSLAKLEANLEAPVVPGELVTWSGNVCDAAAEVQQLYPQVVQQLHEPEFAAIEEQDLGLEPRVQHLRAGDRQVIDQFASFKALADGFAQQVAAVEPDEARLRAKTSELIQRGIEVIVHARMQEAETTTWLVEAYERDRGTVD
jgi:hypothetical protein